MEGRLEEPRRREWEYKQRRRKTEDGRRKTDEEYSPKQGQRRQHQRHRTRRRGCLTGRVRDITSAVGGEEGKLDRSNEAAEEEHLGVKVKVRANEGG
ncbi:hypothetical protein E4U51_007428 [Claviceps purpurea]|nr:hypothetical protein E4U51_007428 [Claviceps purpurea]